MHGLERIIADNAKYPEPTGPREDPRDKLIRTLTSAVRTARSSLWDIQIHGLGGAQRRNIAGDILAMDRALDETAKPTIVS